MAFSFIKWLISLLSGGTDPEKAKNKALKHMAKILDANKYGRFFRIKTGEASPELASFFFNIYKTISPAQAFMQNAAQSARLKEIVLSSFLDTNQMDMLARFSPENLETAGSLNPDQDWDTALKVLKTYKNNTDVISLKLWKGLLLRLGDIKQSGILELIIRYIDKVPTWVSESNMSKEHITGAYLEAIKNEIFDNLNIIVNSKRNALINGYAKTIFGDSDTNYLRFYTEKAGGIYVKKNFEGYTYAMGLNYLQAFLMEVKKEFRELYDLILVRGQWVSTAISLPMSEAIRIIMTLPDRITVLDSSLADEGTNGNKLKTALFKLDRDKNQVKVINANLANINEEAKTIIVEALQNLDILEQGFKGLPEDSRANPSALILNWGDLTPFSENPLADRIIKVNNKLYGITQLLRICTQDDD